MHATSTGKRDIPFRCEPDIAEALQAIKVRDGIPISEQLRRAARMWIESKDVQKPATRRATRG